MKNFFVTIVNTLIRNLNYGVRCVISAVLFIAAVFLFKMSIKKKNDKHPIAWGWFILCLLCLTFSVLYLAL